VLTSVSAVAGVVASGVLAAAAVKAGLRARQLALVRVLLAQSPAEPWAQHQVIRRMVWTCDEEEKYVTRVMNIIVEGWRRRG
jgi:hypothetical protein